MFSSKSDGVISSAILTPISKNLSNSRLYYALRIKEVIDSRIKPKNQQYPINKRSVEGEGNGGAI